MLQSLQGCEAWVRRLEKEKKSEMKRDLGKADGEIVKRLFNGVGLVTG